MKKSITYTDARGQSHNSAESATVSDLAGLLTCQKMPLGAATDIARKIFAKRADLERIFKEHDEATIHAEG